MMDGISPFFLKVKSAEAVVSTKGEIVTELVPLPVAVEEITTVVALVTLTIVAPEGILVPEIVHPLCTVDDIPDKPLTVVVVLVTPLAKTVVDGVNEMLLIETMAGCDNNVLEIALERILSS
jgi:hypothetical protein